jgi:arylsulfatase A-like enzyme
MLKAAGYETHLVSTNPHVHERFGFTQGYDHYVYEYHLAAPLVNSKAQGMLSGLGSGEPVFMYLHTMEPHEPYDPSPGALARFDRHPGHQLPKGPDPDALANVRESAARFSDTDLEHLIDRYDGEIADVDAAFGQFLHWLRAEGRFDDSMIILVADHGEAFAEHDTMGHGHTLCQEEVHVPLVIRFPGGRLGGRRVSAPVSLIDVMPTVLATLGLDLPEAYPLPGRDLGLVAANEEQQPPRFVFFEVSMGSTNERDLVGVMDGDGHKRVIDLSVAQRRDDDRPWMGLWDTRADPDEKIDLTSDLPATSAWLEQVIASWLSTEARSRPFSPTDAPSAEMSDELRRQLEALGYLH